MDYILILPLILGVLTIKNAECQEFMTLNVPSTSPFMYHPAEHLMMDMSERHPVFLYASSQNDFIHQRVPEHHVVPPNLSRPNQRHRQNSIPKPKFQNSPSPRQRENKPRNSPQLTYGFQPKPPTNRYINHQVQKQNNYQKNQQNEGYRTRQIQKPIHQPSVRHEIQKAHDQRKQFTEHIQVQSSVHHKQQNENSVSSSNHQNGLGDFSQPFNYLSHIMAPGRQFSSTNTPNRNNQLHQNAEGNRKPVHNNQRVRKGNEENRQENTRKQVTFEGAAQAFKSRLNTNNQATDGTFPPKIFDNNHRQNLPERNLNHNERINMQHYARSMRENMPQLPPRPPFNNGAIKINTLAGELPVLHFDSINTLNENPTVYLQSDNHHEHAPVEEQEKKTYLLIKAPSAATTERPSAQFVGTSQQYTSSPPYMINDYRETSPNLPEITHSTVPEPRGLPQTAETPAIVLDLVQIPDHAIFNHAEHVPSSLQQPEFRSLDNKYRNEENLHSTESYPAFRPVDNTYNNEESFQPTESYPTTPMQGYKDVIHHKKTDYTSIPEYSGNAYYSYPKDRTYSTLSSDNNPKYQSKLTSKPKIKELLKSSNFSSLPPISYSSSVSVVSVKHSTDNKPSQPKKQKTTLKKALSSKKKAKIPENEHVSYDDYDDGQGVPGDPGIDYPTYKDIPPTNFECKNEKTPGFYADIETGCQVFHNCDTGMAKHSFMCPNGTIFNQELFICDWWYNVKCENSPEFYTLNSGLFITGNNQEESSRKI